MGYDDRGYITSETAYTNYGTAKTVNKTYTYDSIGRLTQAAIGDKTSTYTYDNVGNRLTKSDGTDSFVYTYNQFNQLTGTTKNSAFYASYTYDGRGNQTQELRRSLTVTINGTKHYYNTTTDYSYDLLNSMTGTDISTPKANHSGDVSYDDTTVSYEYNAQGRRVEKVDENETTKYYYTGSALLYTANATNWLTTENILDPGGKIVASQRFADQDPNTEDAYADKYYFYHFDKRGSVSAIIQPDGNMVKGYEYDEFGNLEGKGADDFLNEVTFTGSITDKSTGLQYMNARYYNPTTGRFLSQDTYSGNPYDPWTQHLYSYCGNNPASFVDPTGHRLIIADDEHGRPVVAPVTRPKVSSGSSSSPSGSTQSPSSGSSSSPSGGTPSNSGPKVTVTPEGENNDPLTGIENGLTTANWLLDNDQLTVINDALAVMHIYAGVTNMLSYIELAKISRRNHEQNYNQLRSIMLSDGPGAVLKAEENIQLYPVFIPKGCSATNYRSELGDMAIAGMLTDMSGTFGKGIDIMEIKAGTEGIGVAVNTIGLCAPPPYNIAYDQMNMMATGIGKSKYDIQMIWGSMK